MFGTEKTHQMKQQPISAVKRVLVGLGLGLIVALTAATTLAGGIAGTITDAATGLPINGIDLDIFDANFVAVPGINDSSAADGTYLLTPLPAGQYYLRADPSASEGYVDQYHPGVFLKAQATPVTVSEFGTEIVDFSLEVGFNISGTITDAATGSPIEGMDLDVFAGDQSYIGSINARTAADGTYTLGSFPIGSYFVEADPETTMYVRSFYSDQVDISFANPVLIDGSAAVTGINFQMVTGGKISGTITDQTTGLPLAGIDLDLFDAQGNFLSYLNAATLADGTFELGAMPAGTYYLQADPTPVQGYIATYFGGASDILGATPITVSPGVVSLGTDIALTLGGTISGVVTSSVTGLPVAGARVSVFDALGSILPGVGDNTAADGSFMVGALPAGDFFLRCGGDAVQSLAFQFYPGTHLVSLAQPITAAVGADQAGINFVLQEGGWISGTVRDLVTGLPITLVDMDIYSPQFEFIGALDGDTDDLGHFTLGPVPGGQFVIRAHPDAASGLPIQYYDHSPDTTGALPIDLIAPELVTGIDFDLGTAATAVGDDQIIGAGVRLRGAYPNPFNPRTSIVFELPRSQEVQLAVYSIRGTLVARLVQGSLSAGRHEIVWDGLDSAGHPVASGVFFARLTAGGQSDMSKLVLVR